MNRNFAPKKMYIALPKEQGYMLIITPEKPAIIKKNGKLFISQPQFPPPHMLEILWCREYKRRKYRNAQTKNS